MAFKVNYGFQKAERDRAKQAKKEAKRREKEAAAASPEAESEDSTPAGTTTSRDGDSAV